jgi:fatty-acyl-CoA synthase
MNPEVETPSRPAPPDQDQSIADWPCYWARHRPKALAIQDESRRLDWLSFEERVAKAAGALRRAGIEVGDRIALLLNNRTAYMELFFAAAREGAILTPINTRLSPHEVAFQVDDCHPALLIHDEARKAHIEEVLALCVHTPRECWSVGGDFDQYERLLMQADAAQRRREGSPDEPVILMYTSGTTGSPKGALLPCRKVIYNSLNAAVYFKIAPDDRVLVVAPLFHSLALQILALPIMRAGGALILQSRFRPDRVWDAVDQFGITYFGGVPSMHQKLEEALQASPDDRWRRPALRFVFTAGSAVSIDLIHAFQSRGILLLQGYGQTETSVLTCLSSEEALSHEGTVGRPVHFGEVKVVNRTSALDRPLEWKETRPGEVGEIVVRGPINMLGYWGQPEATADTLVDDWLCTGDLAQRDEAGFITLVGRTREMFISGGENVMPAEVEAVFREHPSIREIAVVGEPNNEWGEVGRAHLVVEGERAPSFTELDTWGRARLAAFKLPRRYLVEKEFPRTASGKIRKHLLKDDPSRVLH